MDRFTRGFLAGFLAGIIMNTWSFFAYYILKILKVRFIDWLSVFLYGHFPNTIPETVFALLVHLGFVGLLGVIFAYLIPLINSKNYLFKGAVYGFTTYFVVYIIAALFRLPNLTVIPFYTVITNATGALIYGLALAIFLKLLDYKPVKKPQKKPVEQKKKLQKIHVFRPKLPRP